MNAKEVNQRMERIRCKLVAHRVALETRVRLFDLLVTAERERVIALIGPAGVGKTAVRSKVCQLLIDEYKEKMIADPGFLPFLSITTVTGLSGDYSWRDGFARLLAAGNEPLIGKKTVFPTIELDGQKIASPRGLVRDELRRAFESMVKNRGIRIIFLDEGSAVIDETVNRHPLRQFNILKSLAVELNVIIVLIGAYDLIGLKDGNGQLIRRVDCIHMPRYQLGLSAVNSRASSETVESSSSHVRVFDALKNDRQTRSDIDEFSAAAHTLMSAGPVKMDFDLLEDKQFLLFKSVGCVGIFRDWFERSCVEALLHHDGVLTKAVFERNALPVSALLKLTAEAQTGEALIADNSEAELAALHKVPCLRSGETNQASAGVPPLVKGRRVGQRGPSRDPVGGARA